MAKHKIMPSMIFTHRLGIIRVYKYSEKHSRRMGSNRYEQLYFNSCEGWESRYKLIKTTAAFDDGANIVRDYFHEKTNVVYLGLRR